MTAFVLSHTHAVWHTVTRTTLMSDHHRYTCNWKVYWFQNLLCVEGCVVRLQAMHGKKKNDEAVCFDTAGACWLKSQAVHVKMFAAEVGLPTNSCCHGCSVAIQSC